MARKTPAEKAFESPIIMGFLKRDLFQMEFRVKLKKQRRKLGTGYHFIGMIPQTKTIESIRRPPPTLVSKILLESSSSGCSLIVF